MLTNFIRYFGWRNWSVFKYNSFIENIFFVFYIALILKDYSSGFMWKIVFFYLFSVFSTSYGYLINDFSDKALDEQHRKPNTFQEDSRQKAFLIVLLFLLSSIIFAIPFSGNAIFIVLWIMWILMTTAYSVKPLRLKERGSIGLIDVVLAQRVMPILLVFAAFEYASPTDIVLITMYILFRGLASDINHQLEDYPHDRKTDTRTFAVSKGYEKTGKIFQFVLEGEKLLLLFILIAMLISLNEQSSMPIHPIVALLILYLAAYLYSIYRMIRGRWENPFDRQEKSIFQFIHHPFPSVILPLFLLCNLIVYNLVYIFLLIMFLWNKRLLNKETILNSYPYSLLRKISSSH